MGFKTKRFSPNEPLNQMDPYNWGSIINGHLEALVITAAFSRDIWSAGNPSFFHYAILLSEVKIPNGVIP